MPSDNKNYYDFKLFFEYSTYLLLICPVLKNQIILKICNMAYVLTMSALHAALVLMNVLLKLSLKVISM